MSKQSPSQLQDKIVIRVPDGLRERIQHVAATNGRSANEELVSLLERIYRPEMILDAFAQGIADVIGKIPVEDQDALWKSAFEKLDTARRK